MTRVMCNPWKKIFTLAPLVHLTMFSPLVQQLQRSEHQKFVQKYA